MPRPTVLLKSLLSPYSPLSVPKVTPTISLQTGFSPSLQFPYSLLFNSPTDRLISPLTIHL